MRRLEIYQALREDILTCRLPPGAELREQELAQQFDVSKSPVREALQHLVSEGLMTVMPRQGYRVAPLSMTDAHEMFGLRQVLELACVAESARGASDAQLKALDEYRTFDGADRDAFIVYNREFHCSLARCCPNARMSRMACDLIEEMDRLVRMSVGATRGRDPQKLVTEHAKIIDAVQARDAKKATSLLKAHTSAAEKRFITALEWAAVQA